MVRNDYATYSIPYYGITVIHMNNSEDLEEKNTEEINKATGFCEMFKVTLN